MENRPQGREKNISGTGKNVEKRGDGLNTGPVGGKGSSGAGGGRRDAASPGQQNASYGQTRASGGGSSLLKIIIAAVVVLAGGGAGIGLLGGGGGDTTVQTEYTQPSAYTQPSSGYTQSGSSSQQVMSSMQGFDISSLLGGSVGGVSADWTAQSNTGRLDTTVDAAARAKRTTIYGGGSDVVTIMVYMCGTDLESKSGMGTSDLQEMVNAKIGENVNLLVYTGGCKSWRNNVVSSTYNQIYKIETGGLRCLVENDGKSSMTSPDNLTGFIKYCAKNFPANRNELIFWDHGGGSLSGYGYDEKLPSSGSMTLREINDALYKSGVSFDFIGFDACLMATYETALTLAPYADYLIASEETEPGLGWYYTDWLTKLSKNTAMPTLEIGKNIVDDFVRVSAQKCAGQKTTLSVVDLAEFEKTTPAVFNSFAVGTSALLQGNEYQTVSNARSSTREFAASNRIDQVDLVHLAQNINTEESLALARTLLNAVKYNNTSSDITNAYGLSIYFPYKQTSKVDSAVAEYNAIGLDSEYSRCIQQFASMEVGGQTVAGGASSPLPSLFGAMNGGSMASSDMISGMLGSLLGGGGGMDFLGRSLDVDSATEYLTANRFDSEALVWTEKNGEYGLYLPEEQWALVHEIELNVFIDDGEGYIDLGLDNVFDYTEDGALKGAYEGTWLAINDQPIAYYHTDTVYDGDDMIITGRVPILLNGERADLIIRFFNSQGSVVGVRSSYLNGETETIAKGAAGLEPGDEIQFLCDYYSYDGEYENSYYLGDPIEYDGELTVTDVYLPNASDALATYLVTDIYCQEYWTPVIP
ncbi:MAG: peptidase C11 [Oscillospiraceae bacterium]|nr:peptidase C11 [Oscillospiraceae bacterium]